MIVAVLGRTLPNRSHSGPRVQALRCERTDAFSGIGAIILSLLPRTRKQNMKGVPHRPGSLRVAKDKVTWEDETPEEQSHCGERKRK